MRYRICGGQKHNKGRKTHRAEQCRAEQSSAGGRARTSNRLSAALRSSISAACVRGTPDESTSWPMYTERCSNVACCTLHAVSRSTPMPAAPHRLCMPSRSSTAQHSTAQSRAAQRSAARRSGARASRHLRECYEPTCSAALKRCAAVLSGATAAARCRSDKATILRMVTYRDKHQRVHWVPAW